MIDDSPVHLSGFIQIFKMLADGIGAFGTVYGIGAGIMPDQEIQVVVNLREIRIHDFSRHKVGKYFLGPHIIEPLHGNQIPKPHV